VVIVDWLNRFPATPRPFAVANFFLDIMEGLVPWTLLVILAAGATRAHWRVSAVRFAALWAAVPLMVLLLVGTPLERYALSIYPGAALLAAWWAFAYARQRSRAAAMAARISLALSAALIATILLGPSVSEHVAYIPTAWPRRIPLLAAAALMGLFLFWGLHRARPRLLVYGVTAAAALLLGYGNRVHAEWLNRTQDFKGLAARLERYAQGREARVYGGRFFQIDFYLGRPFLQIRTNEEFNRFVLGPDHPVVLIDEPRGWRTLRPTAPPEVGILDRMRVRGRDMLIVGIARPIP
jgi:4-amino-4-deoxy-L-arabinose transferase-like glycosyltransferase